ncbi:transcriptional regulator STERILE APETALA [Salvia miltiorrhiza]|uniref:transcriptional regulator STERILE APETALA n=1 Tax=Salvia miltiorrhiza TaxID=226208 RepID=UPI0025AC0F04|nr:transcriptional regulator STERILE APETALA [Salvia miltiorrhiza]
MSTSSSSSSGGGGGGGSSRRRMRSRKGVWPEPFVEALAFQVAIDASLHAGRLAAAQALFNIFQVCSTWRAISRSELLWQNLTRRIWNAERLRRNTWREEYISRHRTAANFRQRSYVHTTLPYIPADNINNGLSCRRLALSDDHLAAGFSDGAVYLFHLLSRLHLTTFYPHHRDRLGRFSSSVSGIILSDVRLVFATLDGDIHVTTINGGMPLRRAHIGDVVNDGALVDFTGSNRWWVGLYAGVPGRAFHIRNGETEELVFVGGTLTDPEAVMGWHLLTEMTDLIGRVRATTHQNAVACTSSRVILFDLQNQGVVVHEEELRRGIMVGCFDANGEAALITDGRGTASVRRLVDLAEACRFRVRGAAQQRGRVLGCVNGGYGVIISGGVVRVWEIERGEYLYSFRERIGDCSAIVADERYVAAAADGGIIHLWDFGGQ